MGNNDIIYSGKAEKRKGADKKNQPKELFDYDSRKNAIINDVLKILAESEFKNERNRQQLYKQLKDRLSEIYDGNYRHSYYSISAVLYRMDEEELDRVFEGLRAIHTSINKDNKNLYNGIRKLYDHVQLEIVRIRENNERKAELQKIGDNNIELINKRMIDMNSELEAYNKKISDSVKDVYTQIVGILGIFAAIVIVFFGGASVFANVFSDLDDIEWWSVMPVIAGVGFVMFNLIFMFLFIVARMVDKDIGVVIADKYKRNWLIKVCCRYPYVVFFNVVLLILFFVAA